VIYSALLVKELSSGLPARLMRKQTRVKAIVSESLLVAIVMSTWPAGNEEVPNSENSVDVSEIAEPDRSSIKAASDKAAFPLLY
jgi:hypothetical protein